MTLLQNLKISTKIVSLLLLLGAITLGVAWTGSRNLRDADADYSALVDTRLPNTTQLARVSKLAYEMNYAAYRTIAYDGASEQARRAVEREAEAFREANEILAAVRRAEPGVAERLDGFRDAIARLHAMTAAAARSGIADRNDEAVRQLANADQAASQLNRDLVSYNDGRVASAREESTRLTEAAGATSTFLMLLALGGVAGGVGLALFVVRSGVTGPLGGLREQMAQIASGDYRRAPEGTERGDEVGAMARAVAVFRDNGMAKDAADAAKARADADQQMVVAAVSAHLSSLSAGDLTSAIQEEFPAEYASLKTNFNAALSNLRDLIGSVGESTAAIRTGSGEIAQASEDLARRTEGNAASLEETAASVTQIDGRLRASAGAAARTVERADQAIATVGGGRQVAEEAVAAMGRVADSAKGIDSVIEGLDKIAFQTRVLAMNAAVEAGRAGDAGRGFAVVADLVSALAMRAEEEAKRARDQLTVTQTDIVCAVDAVQKVDGALSDISGDVGQVHELLATMAADNQAQSAAITQISSAIGSMDQATQQNAAMVEETSAAARSLAAEVEGLAEQAARFNTGAAPAARAPVTPARFAGPARALPAAAVPALTRAAAPADQDDWKEF